MPPSLFGHQWPAGGHFPGLSSHAKSWQIYESFQSKLVATHNSWTLTQAWDHSVLELPLKRAEPTSHTYFIFKIHLPIRQQRAANCQLALANLIFFEQIVLLPVSQESALTFWRSLLLPDYFQRNALFFVKRLHQAAEHWPLNCSSIKKAHNWRSESVSKQTTFKLHLKELSSFGCSQPVTKTHLCSDFFGDSIENVKDKTVWQA